VVPAAATEALTGAGGQVGAVLVRVGQAAEHRLPAGEDVDGRRGGGVPDDDAALAVAAALVSLTNGVIVGAPSAPRWAMALTLPDAGTARSTGPITASPLSSARRPGRRRPSTCRPAAPGRPSWCRGEVVERALAVDVDVDGRAGDAVQDADLGTGGLRAGRRGEGEREESGGAGGAEDGQGSGHGACSSDRCPHRSVHEGVRPCTPIRMQL
jgi:hypothetical protein